MGVDQHSQTATSRRIPWLLGGALLLLLILAGIARWRYIQTISLYVDEFTTLWAASWVQKLGVPRMPSGVLYTRGLLSSYVEALFLALFGDSYTAGRLPSLLFGLATLLALFGVGRRLWNSRVGLLAAAGLTLLPEAIIWSGRARFYAQLQFFALLAVWAAFEAVAREEGEDFDAEAQRRKGSQRKTFPSLRSFASSRLGVKRMDAGEERRWLWLFGVFFLLSLFSQEQTILLYPSILLAMVIWRGWRFLLKPTTAAVHLLVIGGMILRYAIEKVGQPGYFETIQARRPYIGLVFDVRGAWDVYAPLLIAPERLPWTLLGLLAAGVALAALARRGWRLGAISRFHQASLFFALQFAFVFGVMLALVGTSWRDPRYLYMIQPFWLLLGSAGAIRAMERLLRGERGRWLATAGLALAVLASFWRPAQATLTQQVEGYDQVLALVAADRQPGDVILSPQPPACAQVLGEPCDYYAIQRDYEEYVIPRDGALVDRWSGAELLNTPEQLEAVIKAAPRVWLITDGLRLATRYDADFLATVIEQFDPVFQGRGVVALRAQGWRERPNSAAQAQVDPPLAFGPLALVGWSRGQVSPGQPLDVTLVWQATGPIDRQINTSLRVVSADGETVAQDDGPPARGVIPTNLFFDAPLPDFKQVTLPLDLPPGRYRIQVLAYELETVTPLGEPRVIDEFTTE